MRLSLLFGRCTLALLLLVTSAASAQDKKSALIPFGSVAPEIAGLVLSGPAGTRLSQFRGRVVVVDFWATWCAPCLQSVPKFNQMRDDIGAMGFADRFEVLSVNVDTDLPKARQFLERFPVDYPVIGDPISIAMQRYGAWKLPATFLLDPEGKVQMIWLGYAEYFTDDIKTLALDLLRDGRITSR